MISGCHSDGTGTGINLVMGRSNVEVSMRDEHEWEFASGLNYLVNSESLRQIFGRHIDNVFILVLTCYFWHKVQIVSPPHVPLVTSSPDARLEEVVQFMQDAYHYCRLANTCVKLFLVFAQC